MPYMFALPIRISDTGNDYASASLGAGAVSKGAGKCTDGYNRVDLTISSTTAITLELQESDVDSDGSYATTETWAVPASTSGVGFWFPLSKKFWRRKLTGGAAPSTVALACMLDPRTIDRPLSRSAVLTVASEGSTLVPIPLGARSVYIHMIRQTLAASGVAKYGFTEATKTHWADLVAVFNPDGGYTARPMPIPIPATMEDGNAPSQLYLEAVGVDDYFWVDWYG